MAIQAIAPEIRAKIERERRRREATRGPADTNPFARYRFDPVGYIREQLGWTPWSGTEDRPGQLEALKAYELALRQLHERDDWEQGRKEAYELHYWQPGQVIKNRIRIEAGHTIGKTKWAGGVFSHFFDTCAPSIIYTFAPGWEQINDLLWKEIRTDRRRGNLPGRVLDGKPQLNHKANHFAKGRATSNAHGRGTERVQGQHGKYLMFILDEAEGIDDYVWRAVESMASGGIAIVLMLANPRTRTSQFHKQRSRSDVANFRISCLWHPNVVEDREVVPGAVRRDYVLRMLEGHAEPAPAHDPDAHTFDVPFDVTLAGRTYPAGTIFRPDAEFMFRVLGVAPANIADNTFVPSGRYEAATQRQPDNAEPHKARMGVDAARYGSDMGTLYVRHAGRVWREAQFAKLDGHAYYVAIRQTAQRLRAQGVTSLHVRVDAGGGFGGSVADFLNHDPDLAEWFDDFEVIEVHFNAAPSDEESYDDLVTEMYADVGESLRGLVIEDAPEALEADLTERTYRWVNRRARAVKKLTDKEQFRKERGRSPDDGDGFVLAVASDFLFDSGVSIAGLGSLYGQR